MIPHPFTVLPTFLLAVVVAGTFVFAATEAVVLPVVTPAPEEVDILAAPEAVVLPVVTSAPGEVDTGALGGVVV